ncbi:RCC1 repeat-containing protein [Myxococcus stipitatus]|uniref:RCC1 domain-containing protein n=1 Tax=Myxococcus stipitatus TaxID=83455 RepID=UPI001F333C26|nr:RCC1 repeat-containing protein [Myxococcus stipitatus]MCE9672828.1 RCC1 repeat-containing protein [Myxococcus stipitatus]
MRVSALLLAVCHLLVITATGCGNQEPVAAGSPTTGSKAALDYVGCSDDYIDNHGIVYQGFTLDYSACGAGAPQPSTIRVSWTHDIPSGIAVDATSSSSYGRVRFDSGANQNVPLSVTQLETFTHPGSGIAMTRYRVEYSASMAGVNYCTAANLTTNYRLATDCDEWPLATSVANTTSLTPNTYKVYPYLASVSPSGSRMLTVSTEPLPCPNCHPPALGDSPEHVFEYRKQGTLAWTVVQRTNLSSFRLPPVSAGTYEYRSRGRLTPNGAYSDYTPIRTVTVADRAELVAGGSFSLVRRLDGTVWLSGAGPTGDGSVPLNRYLPEQVPGLSGIVTVAPGTSHALAVDSNGRVWAWGDNSDGQLGNGSYTGSNTPVQVPGLTGVVAVATGGAHSLALRDDGTVWAWGANSSGQLGDGNTWFGRSTPLPVQGLSRIVAVSAGFAHSLALRDDGVLFAWGMNNSGQLGDGSTTNRLLPVQVPGVSDIVAVDGGNAFSLAVLSNGTVWAWGNNAQGQLGNGTTTNEASPKQVPGLNDVKAVSAGFYDHALAVHANGTVSAWGNNDVGQLGDGTTSARSSPVQVQGLTQVLTVSAGGVHSLALRSDGTARAWGNNGFGQRADGTFRQRLTPMKVEGLSNVKAVTANNSHSLALRNDGTVWGWGKNDHGQLGTGSISATSTLTQVQGLTNVVAISTGAIHSLAVRADGTLWAWGDNSTGQLGDGTTTNRLAPVQVQGPGGAVTVAAGHLHSLALHSDGLIRAWGYNWFGQLGDATIDSRLTPVPVNGMLSSVAIAAGASHSLGIREFDPRAWAWGDNSTGQLGGGDPYKRLYAAPVQDLTGVQAVAAGYYHTLALRDDGSVWAWGANSNGQLGNGSFDGTPWPVQVQGLSGVKAVAAGADQSAAVLTNGTFWTWGLFGGQGQTTNVPVQVGALGNGRSVAVGAEHFVGLLQDGTVWVWGYNDDGQFGSGLPTSGLTATPSLLL